MEAARGAPTIDSPATGTEEKRAPTIVVARSATGPAADALADDIPRRWGGELTPTLKVKRPVIYRRYVDRFDRLYAR